MTVRPCAFLFHLLTFYTIIKEGCRGNPLFRCASVPKSFGIRRFYLGYGADVLLVHEDEICDEAHDYLQNC